MNYTQLMTTDIWKEMLLNILHVYNEQFIQSNYQLLNHGIHYTNNLVESHNYGDHTYKEIYKSIIINPNHETITRTQLNNIVTRGIQLNHNTEVFIMKNNP